MSSEARCAESRHLLTNSCTTLFERIDGCVFAVEVADDFEEISFHRREPCIVVHRGCLCRVCLQIPKGVKTVASQFIAGSISRGASPERIFASGLRHGYIPVNIAKRLGVDVAEVA